MVCGRLRRLSYGYLTIQGVAARHVIPRAPQESPSVARSHPNNPTLRLGIAHRLSDILIGVPVLLRHVRPPGALYN